MVSTEQLEKELEGLQKQEADHLSSLQAVHGAIQFCKHLLSVSSSPQEETEKTESSSS